ncbi:MAG TPA: type IV pilus secretin PilQ [Candidatus Binatia bacterium]|nr:type IV pilus secretin PilQ [Candidatus Binatia bacterium]
MKTSRSSGTAIWLGLRSGRVTPRYACIVGCLLAGFGLGFVGCAPTINEPKSALGVVDDPVSAQASGIQQTATKPVLGVQDLSVREESGQTILQLKLTQPISQYRHFPLTQPARVVVDMFSDFAQQTDGESFRIDTALVSTVGFSSGKGYLRMTIESPTATVPTYVMTPEAGGIKVVLGFSDPKASEKRSFDLVRGGKKIDAKTLAAASIEPGPAASLKEGTGAEEKKYTGQKLSLDFKDADIKNVFRLLAEVSGKNIVVTDDVNRKVTLRLVEVPWDQAMDLLITTNGLGKDEVGNVIRISTTTRLEADQLQQKKTEKAREDAEPLQTAYFNINYARVKDLESKVKVLLTKRPDAALVIDERSNTMMVRDIRQSVDDVSALIAKLDTRTPQVLIESNLIETTPTFARALGLRFQFSTSGGTTISSAAGAPEPYTAFTPLFPNAPIGLGGSVSVIQNRVGGLRDLASTLEAAERDGNIKIMSRPSVVTLNNVASTIRSERILRIQLPASTNIATGTGSSAAGAAVATEKVPIGIILTVTPQVSSDGFVLMNINVKSSTLGAQSQGSVIPDELNREAVANVLVKDGETIVLGGILKDTSQDSESGVPYLKDIPVLGWIFKNQRVQKDFEELMVFITPRITSAGSENLPAAEQLWREQMRQTDGDQVTFHTLTP